jgi:hypothetical protein
MYTHFSKIWPRHWPMRQLYCQYHVLGTLLTEAICIDAAKHYW